MRLRDGDPRRSAIPALLPRHAEIGTRTAVAEVTCYAESTDGIHWTKPDLGLFNVGGSKTNNVVLAGLPPFSHNFSPMLDTRQGVPPSQRYKALAGTVASGLAAFVSEDGLRWCKLRDQPVLTKESLIPRTSRSGPRPSMLIFATCACARDGVRRVGRASSPDFVTWTEPALMTYGDRPIEHLYTNQTSPYFRSPHLYIGIAAASSPAARFFPGMKPGRSVSTRITFTTVLTRSS